MPLAVRPLTPADATAYRDIRLEAVRTELYSFERTIEEEEALPPETWVERLAKGNTFGLFDEGELIGTTILWGEVGPKVKHRAHLGAVYVRPEMRGTGASRPLLDTVIEIARAQNYLQVYLVVSARSERAVRFYQRAGFVIYATDPRGLFSAGEYVDDYLMMLRLD